MKIDRVYINTHKYDLAFTRICIGSIRYWYPNLPISLIVDHSNGVFNTTDLKLKWNVDVLDNGNKKYGWGFGKFEPLFLAQKEAFLILDADTVLTGPILQKLEQEDADFIVDDEVQTKAEFEKLYYTIEPVEQMFPGFRYPGYSFNTGQWAGRSGVLELSDFEELVTWNPTPALKHRNIFKQADQGLFNFIVQRKEQQGSLTIGRKPIMLWPGKELKEPVELDKIKNKTVTNPFIIHWAGIKFKRRSDFPLLEIALFYEDYFYSKYTKFYRIAEMLRMKWFVVEKKLKSRMRQFAPR